MKFITLLVLLISFVFGRNKYRTKYHSCQWELLSDECPAKSGGKLLKCDKPTGQCRVANGVECNTKGENACMTGSYCSGTKETNFWGKCDSNILTSAGRLIGLTRRRRY